MIINAKFLTFLIFRKLEPLHDFAREGEPEELLTLIANGASVNSRGLHLVFNLFMKTHFFRLS